MGVDRTQDALGQCDVDPCGLVTKFAGIDVDNSPSPAAKVTLLSARSPYRAWSDVQIADDHRGYAYAANHRPAARRRGSASPIRANTSPCCGGHRDDHQAHGRRFRGNVDRLEQSLRTRESPADGRKLVPIGIAHVGRVEVRVVVRSQARGAFTSCAVGESDRVKIIHGPP